MLSKFSVAAGGLVLKRPAVRMHAMPCHAGPCDVLLLLLLPAG